jgi:rhodanese-related sulfurtransferase
MGFAIVTFVAGSLCSCSSSGGSERTSATLEKGTADRIKEVSPQELQTWMSSGKQFTLIDVREDDEWQTGHASAAVHISRWTLSGRISSVVADKTACIVLYCKGGVRSVASAATLQKLGYTNVFSLAGGFKNYQFAGLPVQR